MKLRPGEYNVRVVVDKDGTSRLGFVHRLYKNTTSWMCEGKRQRVDEWRDAPESTRRAFDERLSA